MSLQNIKNITKVHVHSLQGKILQGEQLQGRISTLAEFSPFNGKIIILRDFF